MCELSIIATKDTPTIIFNPETNTLIVEGNSFPENTLEFYTPLLSWIEAYLECAGNTDMLTVNFSIEYYNSSTSKLFMNFFRILDIAVSKGQSIIVNWFYDEEDEDGMEEGEDFKIGIEALEFNLVRKAV